MPDTTTDEPVALPIPQQAQDAASERKCAESQPFFTDVLPGEGENLEMRRVIRVQQAAAALHALAMIARSSLTRRDQFENGDSSDNRRRELFLTPVQMDGLMAAQMYLAEDLMNTAASL